MVSLPAGGMKSLGEYLGQVGHLSTKIIDAFAAMDGQKFGPRLSEPRVTTSRSSADDIVDLTGLYYILD